MHPTLRYSLRGALCGALLVSVLWAAPAVVVAPNGDDQANGGPQAPLKTLGGALARARQLRTQGEVGEIRVEIRSGAYVLAEPLALTPADSELTFAAAPGARVTVTSGQAVTGWTKWRGDVWQAPLPAAVDPSKGRIRSLFYEGKAQPRSREPNPENGDWRYTGWLFVDQPASDGDRRSFTANLRDVPPVASPQNVEVDIFPWHGWNNSVVGLAAMDVASGRIDLTADVSYHLSPGNRFRLENAPEWIDQLGEWAVDPAARVVYFRAPVSGLAKVFGGSKPSKPVLVPALPTLVQLQGDATTAQPVRNVSFIGLEFTCSLPGSAVVLDTVRECRFESCTFRDLGGTAIEFKNANRGNIINQCTFARLGASGVTMFPGTTGHCTDNVISHNLFHDLGMVDRHVAAVYAGTSNGNLIAHNLIHHMPRYAISFKHGFGRNIVEWNEIRWTNLETNDTGAIESWQWEPRQAPEYDRGNVIRHNLIADTVGLKASPGGRLVAPTFNWGIYMDDYSSRNEIVGNLIVRTVLGGICLHGGWENLCQYNISVDGTTAAVYYNNIKGRMQGNRVLNNIFYNRDQGPRIHLGGNTPEQIATHDFNLYWPQPTVQGLANVTKGEEPWQAWRGRGYDTHSEVVDPDFVNPAVDDFRLRPDSPALRLGFRATDFSEVGLRGTDMWTASVQMAALSPVKLPKQLPPEEMPRPAPLHASQPTVVAFVNTGGVNVDGLPLAEEWSGLYSVDRLLIAERPNYGGMAKSWAFASVMHDAQYLHVALDVPVPGGPDTIAGTPRWGHDDGAELCVRAVTRKGDTGPIVVLRGYPSSHLESSTEAGASSEEAAAIGAETRFAAIRSKAGWTAEYAVPVARLGVPAEDIDHFRFNIGIRKKRTNEWLAWVGTSAENWRVDEAGIVKLSPAVLKTAPQVLLNGGFDEPDGARPRHWFLFGDKVDQQGVGEVLQTLEGAGGTPCLQLSAKVPPTHGIGAMQTVPTPAAGTYLLSLYVRGKGLAVKDGEAGLIVSVRYIPIEGRGRMQARNHQQVVSKVSSLWEPMELPVEIPADTAVMTVTIQFRNATGTVWVDKASLHPVAEK
jgi:hypothetical protein